MAQELATALKFSGERYPEGTPLAKLPNKAAEAAKNAGILRMQKVQADGEEDFEVVYNRAVEHGLVELSADELRAAVAEAEEEEEEEEEESS